MEPTPGDRLILTVTTPGWDRPRIFEIGPAGGWIGRDRGCEVAIDDADQFLSSRHARIDHAKDAFWLSDQSTNGTFLNGSMVRMEPGQRHRLADGDTFRAGLFDIAVAVRRSATETPADASGAAAGRDTDATMRWAGDPLSDLGFGSRTTPQPEAPKTMQPLYSDPLGALISDLIGGAGAPPPNPTTSATGDRSADRFFGDSPYAAASVGDPFQARAAQAADGHPGADAPARPNPAEALPAAAMPPLSWPAAPDSAVPAAPAMLAAQAVTSRADLSIEALGAFWHGLGILPRSLRPDDLVAIMAEFGAALREASDNFAAVLRTPNGEDQAGRNPFAGGHGNLRRYLGGRPEGMLPLDDAVRDVFTRIAERDQAYGDAVRTGIRRMAQSIAASSIEKRFGATLQSRRPRSRRAELWHLFSAMESELVDLAEAVFQRELADRLRGKPHRPAYRGADGEDL